MTWCGVAWWGVTLRGVAWCGVVWRGRYGYDSREARSVVANVTGSWAWTRTGPVPVEFVRGVSGFAHPGALFSDTGLSCTAVPATHEVQITLVRTSYKGEGCCGEGC